MSLEFVNGSNHAAVQGTAYAVSISAPLAISLWIRPDTIDGHIFSLRDSGNPTTDYERLLVDTDSFGGNLIYEFNDGVASDSIVLTAFAPTDWVHVLIIIRANNDRELIVNGSSVGTSTTSVTPSARNEVLIGTNSPLVEYDGLIAEIGIWDLTTDLTTFEEQSLSDGFTPLTIRPEDVKSYWPLIGAEPWVDVVRPASDNTDFSGVGVDPIINDDHPPVIKPTIGILGVTAVVPASITKQLVNTIAFTNVFTRVLELTIQNTVEFDNDAETNQIVREIFNTLNLSVSIEAELELTKQITNIINFQNTFKPSREESISNIIAILNNIFRAGDPENNVGFVQIISALNTKGLANTVSFTNSISAQVELTLPLQNTINLSQNLIQFDEANCDLHEYNPFGSSLPAAPVLTPQSDIQFIDGLNTLTIRNPNFGDGVTIAPRRVLNQSRKGSLNIYRNSIWGKRREFSFSVRLLKAAQKQEVLDFLLSTNGREITYRDPENRSWTGILLQPESGVQQVDRETYEVSFVFRGLPV